MWQFSPRSASVILLLLLAVNFAGCTVCNHVDIDERPFVVVENGSIKHLYAADGSVYAFVIPFIPFEGGTTGVFLVDSPQKPWAIGFPGQTERSPRWRSLDLLVELAEAMGPPYPRSEDSTGDPRYGQPLRIRWILSLNPLVVAIGTSQTRYRFWGGAQHVSEGEALGDTFALPREDDLGETATELVILDTWPPPWPIYGENPHQKLIDRISPQVRKIQLPSATSLAQLMRTRPWEKAMAPAATTPQRPPPPQHP